MDAKHDDDAGTLMPASLDIDPAFWLKAAERAVRRYCGWHVAPRLDLEGSASVQGGRILRLPCMHVTKVTALDYDGVSILTDCRWDEDGRIECARPLPPLIAGLHYHVTAGWDPEDVPDVQSVILQAARRAAQTPAGIVKSQSVNGASVTYGYTGGGPASVQLLAAEKTLLDGYRLGGTP